jgi:AraC family transcriptional regulator
VSASKHYHARLQRVLSHVEEHLGDDLSVEVLSGVAAFSRHHFHRQFTTLFDISVHRYVQLVRLKRASYRLAFRDDESILEIALDSGFEAPEAFSRAFKQRLGQTPSEFRKQPQWASWHATYRPISATRKLHMRQSLHIEQVKIVDVTDTRVAVLEHRGDPALVGNSVRRFINWRKQSGLPPKTNTTFNILYDDPDSAQPSDFRLDLCVATDREISPNEAGVVGKTIPGGRCAMLRHVGSEDSFGDFPLYCQRISFFPDVPEHEATRTSICR